DLVPELLEHLNKNLRHGAKVFYDEDVHSYSFCLRVQALDLVRCAPYPVHTKYPSAIVLRSSVKATGTRRSVSPCLFASIGSGLDGLAEPRLLDDDIAGDEPESVSDNTASSLDVDRGGVDNDIEPAVRTVTVLLAASLSVSLGHERDMRCRGF